MQRGFLKVSDDKVLLLGFPLKLSPTELKLLTAICEGDMTVEELSSLLNEGVSRQNVAVHINSINRKAEFISGRRLVIFSGERYTLNPYM